MKIKGIYFERYAGGLTHVHSGVSTYGVYFPSKNAVLCKERAGTFGRIDFLITTKEDNPGFFSEMESLRSEEVPQIKGTHYSNVREVEFYEERIAEIIETAKYEKLLAQRVKEDIVGLLEESKK